MSSLSSGMKTSFSTNSSLYSTPCQSPGSLGSSLDSTHLSLQSKESLTTTGPSVNGGLLAIQVHQDNYNPSGNNQSLSGSCSSASSLNSVRTLLPPSTTINGNNKSQNGLSKSINYPNAFWQDLYQLRQDLMLKLSGLRQQTQSIVHQLDEVEIEMISRLNGMCQLVNGDTEGKSMNDTPEVNGTFLISPIGRDSRKSVPIPIPIEPHSPQLSKLIATKAISKLPALVKGYLTRRLMRTSKVKNLIKTIRDTTILLDNYRSEDEISQEEIDFHRRLMAQLDKSLAEFHDVFFTHNKSEQMKLIAHTRDVVVEKALRLSTEARRLQAEKARKFVHDKRKDSPLTTNTMRVLKQSRKDGPEHDQGKKQEKDQESKPEEKVKDVPQETAEEKFEEKSIEKQNGDVEMQPIDEPKDEMKPKSKTKAKANSKPKSKAPAKVRKSAKNTKKVSVNSDDTESSTNPSSTSPESAAPTPPALPLPPTPEPTEVPDTSKSSKESGPKRPKRTVSTVKRVTRATKKS